MESLCGCRSLRDFGSLWRGKLFRRRGDRIGPGSATTATCAASTASTTTSAADNIDEFSNR
jgi:hypothetical protein